MSALRPKPALPPKRAPRSAPVASPGHWPSIPVLVTTLAVATGLFIRQDRGLPPTMPLRLLSMIPVAMAAYRANGAWPGIALAAFFGSLFIAQDIGAPQIGAGALSRAGALLTGLLGLVAYASAEIAGSLRVREGMRAALRDREALLDRSTDAHRLAEFLLHSIRAATRADHAALLWCDEADDRWWLRLDSGRCAVHDGEGGLSLAAWLITHHRPLLLNDLPLDPRFGAPTPAAVLAQPIVSHDGKQLAVLVAYHAGGPDAGATDAGDADARAEEAWRRCGQRHFGGHEAEALAQLAEPAAQALIQAGAHAHKERITGRLTERLAAVGAAARDLNRSMEPHAITRATLNWALTVTGAAAGFIRVQGAAGDRVVVSCRPGESGDILLSRLLDLASDHAPAAGAHPPARSCLRAAIRRGDRSFGEVVVAVSTAGLFDSADEQALTALAEHAGIALENASLLNDVVRERFRVRQIIENMADGVLATDEARRVTALNPAAQRLTGWGEAQAGGLPACKVLGCEEPVPCHKECVLRQAQETGQASQRERWLLRLPGGEERALALHAAPLPPPAPGASSPGLVVLLQDITDQERMEQFQRDLIAAFSHELRTPLASINTLTELLLDEGAVGHDALSRKHLELLRAQSKRLAAFAERTLDVSRLERGQWELEQRPVPFPLTLCHAVDRWQSISVKHPLQAAGANGGAMWAWADEEAVDIILDNLIENAAKYSGDEGGIFLSAEAGPPGFITVAVRDEGIGVNPLLRERIFDRFYRAEAGDAQRVYGHGLGLYIVRRLVETMGGVVWVEDTGGHGSRFVFTLPQMPRESDANPDH